MDQQIKDPILTVIEMRRLLELLKEASGGVEGEHLTAHDLTSYVEGDQDEATVERIDLHLASCEACAMLIERKLAIPKRVTDLRSQRRAVGNATAVSVVEGDAAPFENFLAEVEPGLKLMFARYRIPHEDGEDIVQQALLALLYQWEGVRDPKTWLFGTVRRHCLMYWRTHRRRIYSAVDAAVLEWLSQPAAPSQERADLLSDLENLIDRLPPRCRSLLKLRFQSGYEPEEVADKLGYRPSSIDKITNRCLAALSRELMASGLVENVLNRRRPAPDADTQGPPITAPATSNHDGDSTREGPPDDPGGLGE